MPETQNADNRGNSKNKVFFRGGFWWITLGAAILIGIVIRLSRVFETQPAQYTFIAQAALNVLILAAILVQALIYRRQWQVMDKSLERTDKIIGQMQLQIEAINKQEGHLARQAHAAKKQWEVLRDQAIHMKRQTEIMGESLTIGSRAYVGISAVGVNLGQRTLYIKVGNIGNTPADQIHVHVEIVLAPENKAYPLGDYDYGSFKLLKGDFKIQIIAILGHLLPDVEFGRINRSESLLIVQGWIDYRDGFGPAPRSEFSLRYSPSADMWITRTERQETSQQDS